MSPAVARYLALGDSYTIGEGVAAGDRWPVRLVAALRTRGAAVDDPHIVARTGWTCDELWAGIDVAHPHGGYALVSLLIGVNDQYRGWSAAEYAPRFTRLLERAIGFAAAAAAGRVLVLSVPDWGVTPFAAGRDRAAIAADIDGFNAVNHAATLAAGARYVDITTESRRAGADASSLAADGLHPGVAMHEAWADLALPVAAAIVGA
ncbi:MAG TPA: GDSL-type esterase/lipase family protein [Gemmatimonadaceae bacterium]|nr:GDSL-type esterase/lipase family protein [Gemmatimonadaceae bacterium]